MALELKSAKVSLKRTVYEKSTGKAHTVYHIDAREYLRRGDFVTSLKLCDKKIQAKIEASKTHEQIEAEKAQKAEDKRLSEEALASAEGDKENLATWSSWTDEELVFKARESGVRDPSNKSREKLIESLESKDVLPSDDKAQPSE